MFSGQPLSVFVFVVQLLDLPCLASSCLLPFDCSVLRLFCWVVIIAPSSRSAPRAPQHRATIELWISRSKTRSRIANWISRLRRRTRLRLVIGRTSSMRLLTPSVRGLEMGRAVERRDGGIRCIGRTISSIGMALTIRIIHW